MTKVRANIGAYSIVGFLVSFDLIRLSREGEAIVQILYFETGEAPFDRGVEGTRSTTPCRATFLRPRRALRAKF